jgi:assimilatory nitrate reductase catalytic subunit
MHWSDRFTMNGVIGRAIAANADPVSGQPELKNTPVRLEPVRLEWSGFLLSRRTFAPEGVDYWARSLSAGCSVYELAGARMPESWNDFATALLAADETASIVQYQDARRGVWRWACLKDGRLESCLFATRTAGLPSRDWLIGLFVQTSLDDLARRKLLSGAGATGPDQGQIVCACFGVGMRQILDAIRDRRLADVVAVGEALRAGTNCGSCIPELQALLQASRRNDAA